MKKVVADLKEYGTVQRAILGIKGTPINDEQQLMDEAMKNLDDNAEVLNSQFPADRGVKYYNGQYSGVMYSVYGFVKLLKAVLLQVNCRKMTSSSE